MAGFGGTAIRVAIALLYLFFTCSSGVHIGLVCKIGGIESVSDLFHVAGAFSPEPDCPQVPGETSISPKFIFQDSIKPVVVLPAGDVVSGVIVRQSFVAFRVVLDHLNK